MNILFFITIWYSQIHSKQNCDLPCRYPVLPDPQKLNCDLSCRYLLWFFITDSVLPNPQNCDLHRRSPIWFCQNTYRLTTRLQELRNIRMHVRNIRFSMQCTDNFSLILKCILCVWTMILFDANTEKDTGLNQVSSSYCNSHRV